MYWIFHKSMIHHIISRIYPQIFSFHLVFLIPSFGLIYFFFAITFPLPQTASTTRKFQSPCNKLSATHFFFCFILLRCFFFLLSSFGLTIKCVYIFFSSFCFHSIRAARSLIKMNESENIKICFFAVGNRTKLDSFSNKSNWLPNNIYLFLLHVLHWERESESERDAITMAWTRKEKYKKNKNNDLRTNWSWAWNNRNVYKSKIIAITG